MTFWRHLGMVVVQDLRIELRRRDGLAAMVFLAVVTAMVMALALGVDGETTPAMGTGVLWVATLLAATMGLARLWQRERHLGGFRGVMSTPVDRAALFMGKSLALAASLLLVELVLLPLVVILFRLPITAIQLPWVCLLVVLGCVGLALIGVLLGAAAQGHTGELLLGAIMYPLATPLLVGGVKGMAAVVAGGDGSALEPWIALMLVADAVFLVAGLWLFESLVAE